MNNINSRRVFVQYRDRMKPYGPIINRKYTVTHSDTTGELFVFVAEEYAEDQVTKLKDELRMEWEIEDNSFVLKGEVSIDGESITGDPLFRNSIFYNEIYKALQALRFGERFLFHTEPELDKARVLIHFISSNPTLDVIYDYGIIGDYKI